MVPVAASQRNCFLAILKSGEERFKICNREYCESIAHFAWKDAGTDVDESPQCEGATFCACAFAKRAWLGPRPHELCIDLNVHTRMQVI